MAADRNARARLVQFLDQKAFDPILRARPDRYSENDREKLQHVKDATRIVPERRPARLYRPAGASIAGRLRLPIRVPRLGPA